MKRFVLTAAFALFAGAALAGPLNPQPKGAPLGADLLPKGATGVGSTKSGLYWFDVAMTPEALDKFYRDALAKRGYRPVQDVHMGKTLSFYFYGGKDGSAVFTPNGKTTNVMLTFLQ